MIPKKSMTSFKFPFPKKLWWHIHQSHVINWVGYDIFTAHSYDIVVDILWIICCPSIVSFYPCASFITISSHHYLLPSNLKNIWGKSHNFAASSNDCCAIHVIVYIICFHFYSHQMYFVSFPNNTTHLKIPWNYSSTFSYYSLESWECCYEMIHDDQLCSCFLLMIYTPWFIKLSK